MEILSCSHSNYNSLILHLSQPHSTAQIRCPRSQIARFMGPTWGPSRADRTQVGPMNLAISDSVLLRPCDAITSISANGSTAFIWKLCFHWLEGLQQQQITMTLVMPRDCKTAKMYGNVTYFHQLEDKFQSNIPIWNNILTMDSN